MSNGRRRLAYQELAADAPEPDLTGRRPVVAARSNQAPARLVQKFRTGAFGPIPVIRARIMDFDVVYSAHGDAFGKGGNPGGRSLHDTRHLTLPDAALE